MGCTSWLNIRSGIPMFFQAEDGIRDTSVTGFQTFALPIYFVIDPFVTWRRPRIRVRPRQVSRLQQMFAVKNVAPEVGIGGIFGELEDGETNHANDKRPSQKQTFSYWRVFVLRHGWKIPVAATDKRNLFSIYDMRFTRHARYEDIRVNRKSNIVKSET